MEEVDQKTLDSLLKPLGFYVKFGYNHWHIYDKFGLGVYGYESSTSEGQYLAELDLNGLLRQISQTKMFDLIENPYFGCNSLEEMLITKDLIA